MVASAVGGAARSDHDKVSTPTLTPPPQQPRRIFRTWRGAVASLLLVLSGIGTAALTVLAQRAGHVALVQIFAIASLVLVLLIVILVVPPLARAARTEVSWLDLPLQITTGGLIFFGVLFIVAFAAWNTGNNLLFLVLAVLASTLFVGWAAARVSLRDLVVSARFPDHIFTSEPAPVIVTLHNTKWLAPSLSVVVEARRRVEKDALAAPDRRRSVTSTLLAKSALAYFIYVPRRTKAEQRVEQIFPQRGRVLITGFELSTRFPFGFFRVRRRLRARDLDLIVYPKPEPASDELHLLPITAGRSTALRRGVGGHDLHSLRDYQPQDDLRHIDWKATARARHLIVREYTAEDERRVHIALDTRPNVGGSGSSNGSEEAQAENNRFERGVMLAASLIAHFIEERAEVRLTLGDEAGGYGGGQEQLYTCLRRLALVTPRPLDSNSGKKQPDFWERIVLQTPATEDNYRILLTTAQPGSIPANIWRTSHVIYL